MRGQISPETDCKIMIARKTWTALKFGLCNHEKWKFPEFFFLLQIVDMRDISQKIVVKSQSLSLS